MRKEELKHAWFWEQLPINFAYMEITKFLCSFRQML